MSDDVDIGIRAALGHGAIRKWLIRVIGRGQVFSLETPDDPAWMGRREMALGILNDCERVQPGAMAQLIQEANDDARERERRDREHDRGIRGDEGPEFGNQD